MVIYNDKCRCEIGGLAEKGSSIDRIELEAHATGHRYVKVTVGGASVTVSASTLLLAIAAITSAKDFVSNLNPKIAPGTKLDLTSSDQCKVSFETKTP